FLAGVLGHDFDNVDVAAALALDHHRGHAARHLLQSRLGRLLLRDLGLGRRSDVGQVLAEARDVGARIRRRQGIGRDQLTARGVGDKTDLGAPDPVGDLAMVDHSLLTNARAVLERAGRYGFFDARLNYLGAARRSVLAAAQDITGADRQDSGHGETWFGGGAARRLTCSPGSSKDGFAFVDLPAFLTERMDAVGRSVDGKPEARPLDELFVHKLLFLHDRGLEPADVGNVEGLGLVEDDRLL